MSARAERDRVGRRAAGFCLERGCAGHANPIRLEDGSQSFVCERCDTPGRLVREQLERGDRDDVVDEVRVMYGYDPLKDIFTFVEVASKPALLGRPNPVTLRTPLIEHPQVARMLAQILLEKLSVRLRRPVMTRCQSRADLVSEGWRVLS